MKNRHIAFLGLTTIVVALWNALLDQKDLAQVDPSSTASNGQNEPGRVIDLERDDFVSIPRAEVDSPQSSWSSRWTVPAWGDWPNRAGREASDVFSVTALRLSGKQFVTIVVGTWWSVCSIFAVRAWIGNKDR